MKSFFAVVVLLLGTFTLSDTTVYANEYSVAPLIIDHDVAPRDAVEEVLKISNTTDHPIRLFPTVNEITVGSEGTVEKFIPASMSDGAKSVTSWIEVSRGQIEIAVGDTVKVPVTIRINPNAAPGEYHAFVGFPEGSNRDEAEKKVFAGTAPGTIVRLSLAEKRSEYLRLEHFSVDRFITGAKEAHATFDLENVGGMALTPAGEIIFYDSTGKERASAKINTENVSIEPGARHSFTVVVPSSLGTIGKYKAFLNVEYGTLQRANLYDTVFFNLVPLKLLIAAFVAMLVVSVVLTLMFHRRRAGRDEEDEEHVAVYVRSGVNGPEKDHDINLKK